MTGINGTTFLSGANAEFIAELYTRYLDDRASVDESWRRFFAEFGDDAAAFRAERAGPPWSRPLPSLLAPETAASAGPAADPGAVQQAAFDSIRALNLIRSYRVRGHLEADLDPLGLEQRRAHNELDYHTWGFTEADLDREIFINTLGRDLFRIPGQRRQPRARAGLGRRQIPSRHFGRPRDRGPHRASVTGRQPVASRSSRPGRARQGARQAASARRRRAQPGGRHPDA